MNLKLDTNFILVVFILSLNLIVKIQPGYCDDLIQKTQNPLSKIISVPFQYNLGFNAGTENDKVSTLFFQPAFPTTIGNWIIINRIIIPILSVPGLTGGLDVLPQGGPEGNDISRTTGLGDINYSVYFTPAKIGFLKWGVGPTINFPTAADNRLGSGKWSVGPTAIILIQPGRWTLDLIIRQLWSFAGDKDRINVNQMLLQPVIVYNLPDNWFVSSAPNITINWDFPEGNKLSLPLGAGISKLFVAGAPMIASVRAYYYVEKPVTGPEWELQLQLNVIIPK